MPKVTGYYESVALFSLSGGEESATANIEKFKKLIEDNATITKIDDWGKRRLAYPINDEIDGHYVLYEFNCTPEFPAELDRVYKITDGVLRWLTIAKEETVAVEAEAAAEEEK